MNTLLNKALHAALAKQGLMEEKGQIIYEMTGGRTKSSRELTDREARDIISCIGMGHDGKCERLRKTLIAMAYKLDDDAVGFVKQWTAKYGVTDKAGNTIKRAFNDYDAQELMQLIKKLEKVITHRMEKVRSELQAP